MADIDTIIIGAGVVGLALGRELSKNHELVVIEKNHHFGEETSSRNSEVIHAGLYYPQNSKKAKFCVEGNHLIYEYATPRNIMANPISKIVVAINENEVEKLKALYQNALNNGVTGLELIDKKQIKALEPALDGELAIWSKTSGIIDSHSLMLSFIGDIENNGSNVVYDSPFLNAYQKNGEWFVHIGGKIETIISCHNLILSCGLWSELVAKNIEGLEAFVPQMKYGKGNYFRYMGKAPFSRLIYPMPTNNALGIHLTPDAAGHARFGPDFEAVSEIDYKVDETRKTNFVKSIRTYWPDMNEDLLMPDYSGIRPKIKNAINGFEDFEIIDEENHGLKGLFCLFGIDSPGLTSSMAIAKYVHSRLNKLGY